MNTTTKSYAGILFGAAVILLLSIGRVQSGIAAPTTTSDDKVTICHFSGHDIDFRLGTPDPGAAAKCGSIGGEAITIAVPACENGHRADGKGLTCAPDGKDGTEPPAPEEPPTKPSI